MKRSRWKFNFISRECIKRTRQLAVPNWTDIGTRLTYNISVYNRGSTACPVWVSLMRRNVKSRILVQLLEVSFAKEQFSNSWFNFLGSGNHLKKFMFRESKNKDISQKVRKSGLKIKGAKKKVLPGPMHKSAFVLFFIKSIVGILERLSLQHFDEFNDVLHLFHYTKRFFFIKEFLKRVEEMKVVFSEISNLHFRFNVFLHAGNRTKGIALFNKILGYKLGELVFTKREGRIIHQENKIAAKKRKKKMQGVKKKKKETKSEARSRYVRQQRKLKEKRRAKRSGK